GAVGVPSRGRLFIKDCAQATRTRCRGDLSSSRRVVLITMNTHTPSRLTDDELIAAVKRHAQGTRESTVALIVHLAELDSRRLALAAGFGSLYQYCREELRLSEHAAYHAIKAIRPAARC